MLIPVLAHGPAYYMLVPILWPLFLLVYYVVPAYAMPYFMRHCIKVSSLSTRTMLLSGMWGFFFALPFVQAFADNFVFLFFITTRSLVMFAFANFLFQWLYVANSSKLSTKQILLSLCLAAMIGYWAVCLFYYAFSYVFVIMHQSLTL